MTKSFRVLALTLLCAVSVPSLASVASALPLANGAAIRTAVPAAAETVQWRGWGWGLGAGIVAGAIVGSAIASGPYGYGPYYGPGPYYAPPPAVYGAPGPVYGPAPVAGNAVAYCSQRFRSYDPASGTYLGFDGLRHPCP
jgi:hypothetical protein